MVLEFKPGAEICWSVYGLCDFKIPLTRDINSDAKRLCVINCEVYSWYRGVKWQLLFSSQFCHRFCLLAVRNKLLNMS